MPIFDTHAHYDADRFDSDRDALLSAMPGVGVGLVLDPGCDLPSSHAAAELAERYPHVYAAVGVHPEDCDGFQDEDLTELRQLLERRTTRPERFSRRYSASSWHWRQSWICR